MSRENYYSAINWNRLEDAIDKMTWEKLVEQFWTDTRIPVSNDLDDWRKLSEEEQDMIGKVFGGLTLLDTLQSQDGMNSLKIACEPCMKKRSIIILNLWNPCTQRVIVPSSRP